MMVDIDWHPTAHLRWNDGVLQQQWTRKCSEYRGAGMGVMCHTWYEHDWHDVPNVSPEGKTANK